jgi:uncharacterized protein YciI
MQYFAWGIDRSDAMQQRLELRDEHWAFLDRFEDRLLARGPVLDDADPKRVLGSIHVVELEDDAEARHFAFDEPFAKNGVFSDVVLTKYRHELGRTQFEYDGNANSPRFFVHCPAANPGTDPPSDVAAAHEAHCAAFDTHVVCRGSLLDDDGNWAGRVFLLEARDRASVEAFVADDPCAKAGLYAETAIRRWTMGGAANLKAVGLMQR